VPLVGTSPTPSIVALVAFVLLQLSVTESPALMREGVALIEAVGAAVGAGGGAAGAGGCFFLQPAMATKATSRTAGAKTRILRFNWGLLSRFLAT
jgi:uncharacterized membrane protein YfcA